MRCYNYLFYCIHRFAIFLGNDGFFPEAIAFFITAMLPWLNLLTVINCIELNTGKSVTNQTLIIVIYFAYLGINYLYFFKGERYKLFLKEAKNAPNNRFKTIVVITYVTISILAHFYFSDLRRAMGKV